MLCYFLGGYEVGSGLLDIDLVRVVIVIFFRGFRVGGFDG